MVNVLAGVFDSFSKQSFSCVFRDAASGEGFDATNNVYKGGDDILVATM